MRPANEIQQTAADVFCCVMEALAFMFGEKVDKEDLPVMDKPCLEARMHFAGHRSGSLALTVPREGCCEVAANILGIDVDVSRTDEKAADALKEVLNVICGHMLTAIAGEEPVFDLSVPDIRVIEKGDWQNRVADLHTTGFSVDEFPMLLTLRMEDYAQDTGSDR